MVKNLPANAGDIRDSVLIPVRKIPWSKKWQPTPEFSSGKFHGQRSLAGYCPRGHRVGHDSVTKSTNSNDASSVSALVCQSEGEKAAWVGMGSGKCDEAPLASECAETSRAQDCALTAVLLGRTTDSDV